jgi:hypothetical protein
MTKMIEAYWLYLFLLQKARRLFSLSAREHPGAAEERYTE